MQYHGRLIHQQHSSAPGRNVTTFLRLSIYTSKITSTHHLQFLMTGPGSVYWLTYRTAARRNGVRPRQCISARSRQYSLFIPRCLIVHGSAAMIGSIATNGLSLNKHSPTIIFIISGKLSGTLLTFSHKGSFLRSQPRNLIKANNRESW